MKSKNPQTHGFKSGRFGSGRCHAQLSVSGRRANAGAGRHPDPIRLDVAIDCRTWRNNQGISFEEMARGDSFIANGKIFRAGTLPPEPRVTIQMIPAVSAPG